MKRIIFSTVLSIIVCGSIFAKEYCSLEEIIDLGIKNNQELKISENYIKELEKNSRLSFGDILPAIYFSWNENDRIEKASKDFRTKSIEFGLTQILFDNGNHKLNYDYKKAEAKISTLEHNEKLEEYLLELIETFYELVLIRDEINLKKQFLETEVKELNLVEYQFEKGLKIKSEYLEHKLLVNSIETELEDYINQYYLSKEKLKNLLFLSEEEEITLSENINNKDFIIPDEIINEKEIIDLFLQKNLQLKKYETSINFQTRQKKIADRFFLPSISVAAGVRFSGTQYPLTQPDYNIKLIFSFNELPFFRLGHQNSYSLNNNGLNGVSNDFSISSDIQPSYFSTRKLSKLFTEKLKEEKRIYINKLKENMLQLISTHNFLIKKGKLSEQSISIKRENIAILETEYLLGQIKTSDYLSEKTVLFQMELQSLKDKIQLLLINKKIKFYTGELK